MRVGYIRVSTQGQNLDRQELLMERMNVEKLFTDKLSGKNTDRPGLADMLMFIREGDEVVVESISRLARNTKDLLNIVEQINEKKATFVSQKENIDTNTTMGKFVLTVFGAIAEMEREYILQRQKEGIEAAKQKGVYKGRKPKDLEKFDEVFSKWNNKQISAVEACRELGISRATFYRRIEDRVKKEGLVKFRENNKD